MAKSLENIVERKDVPEKDQNNLEAKVQDEERKEKKDGFFKKIFKTALAGITIAGAFSIVGFNSIYTAIGNGIGYLIEMKKNKEKFKFTKFLKEVGTGALMGVVGTGIYTAIDKVPVTKIVSPLKNVIPKYYNIVKNVAKTLAFNPGLLIPYLASYKAITYVRDNFKKIASGEGRLKEVYQKGVKPKFWKGVRDLFKLFPIHYANVNWITHVPTRIMIGVGNDILFRLFQKKKTSKPAEYNQPVRDKYQVKDSYTPRYKPSLAGSY